MPVLASVSTSSAGSLFQEFGHGALPTATYVGELGCWSWFHPAVTPSGVQAGWPVLICGPVGAEDLAAHRTLRCLAQDLSARGCPAMRFDWPGQGDSAATAPDADLLALCEQALHDHVAALRASTGAPGVILVGLRLGASLALRVANERSDVVSCVAVAPVMSGRKMLRQWRMLAVSGPVTRERADGSLESGGFIYSAQTCTALQALDLSTLRFRPTLSTLLIDRADFPEARSWGVQQREAGADVSYEALPGYDGMMNVAHHAVVPAVILARVSEWCLGVAPQAIDSSAPAAVPQSPRWQPHGSHVAELGIWMPLPVEGSAPLFGVLAAPAQTLADESTGRRASFGAGQGWGVLMLSSGAERRIGVSGLFCALSREWAAHGVSTLRIDIAGLGDSPAWPGEVDNRVYPKQVPAQIEAALTRLRAQPGVERVMVIGLCSGAFHGLRAAVAGVPMDSLVLLNPAVYIERADMPLDAPLASEEAVQHAATELRRGMGDPRNWRKLLSGKSDLRRIARVVLSRLTLGWQRVQRRMARKLGRPVPDDLVLELSRAVAGGTRLHFCFARHESGLPLLRAEFGSSLPSFLARHRSTLTQLAKADHTYSTEEAREAVAAYLDGLLGLPQRG